MSAVFMFAAFTLHYICKILAGAAWESGDSTEGSKSRQLLQNQYLWPRETAAISASMAIVSTLIADGNGPAQGIKTGARGLEIARLASNKAADPWEYDRPAAPAQRPARQQNALGRRLKTLLE